MTWQALTSEKGETLNCKLYNMVFGQVAGLGIRYRVDHKLQHLKKQHLAGASV